jgi:hypothetical protein
MVKVNGTVGPFTVHLRARRTSVPAEHGDVAMIELLPARGADRTVEDALYRSTAAGWAEHNGHDIPALRGSSG